jgi:phosphatidylserine/phosphatidylglycerophosphate/cardiolipin synthase-like enzyme
VAVYGLENPAGVPVYVHAKVCVIDDRWAAVASDNLNRRSWTHDSELTVAVCDDAAGPDRPQPYAQHLRLTLAREHLDRADGDDADLTHPLATFAEFARDLQNWHDNGRRGPRPPGRLRPLTEPPLAPTTRLWATPVHRHLYDPDGRPHRLRRQAAF